MRMLTEQEHEQLLAAVAERDRLMKLLNTPETLRFLEGTRLEVAHQVERWGTVHDRAKEPADWFWLVGYLAGKALRAHQDGNTEKAQHHCISTAAVLANWHTHIALGTGEMTPGHSDLQKFLRETFGANFLEAQEDRQRSEETPLPVIGGVPIDPRAAWPFPEGRADQEPSA